MNKLKCLAANCLVVVAAFCSSLFTGSCVRQDDTQDNWVNSWNDELDRFEKMRSNAEIQKKLERAQEIKQKRWREFVKFVAAFSDTDTAKIAPDTSFEEDLNIEDKTLANLVTAIEKRYEITITMNDAKNISTVGATYRFVEKAVSFSCAENTGHKENNKFAENDLLYTEEHLWIRLSEDVVTLGITDFHQYTIGDIVHLSLPEIGDSIAIGETIFLIETVKAASDIDSPISGRIIDSNYELLECPYLLNEDPYTKGWIVRVGLNENSELRKFLSFGEYTNFLESMGVPNN